MLRINTIFLKVILLIVFCRHILKLQAAQNRIVGGTTTTIDKVKYIVSLRDRQGVFFCGGSLVKDRYVVTAAHCLNGRKASDIYVHAGATYLQETGIRRSVIQKRLPKNFTLATFFMDIAVLKLNAPISGDNVALIPLCTHRMPVNSSVRIYGWGQQSETAVYPSNQLRTANVNIIAQKTCKENYSSFLNISATMICAAYDKRDSCSGDSGGPLIYRGQLCGVVSFGIGCARKAFPGVYTNVNAAKKFLQKALQN